MARSRRSLLPLVGLLVFVVCPPEAPGEARSAGKPNIVVILADDLGYGDVGALNPESGIPTPHLDRLAGEGMSFTDGHSGSAVCTPTRYGLVTGRYCWRTRLKSGVLNGYSSHLIDPERTTVADVLKKAGYATAFIGKWHLGMDLPRREKQIDWAETVANTPNDYGFDFSYGITASLDFPPYVYVENRSFVEAGTETQDAEGFPAYLRRGERAPSFRHVDSLDHLTQQSVRWLGEQGSGPDGGPFFLYFALTAPHKPVLPHPRFEGRSGLGPYGDFVMQVDWTVGRILEQIDSLGVADRTLVLFSSDNGSFMFRRDPDAGGPDHVEDPGIQAYYPAHHRASHVFRGTKTDIWEGGHRVPFLVRWPGRVEAGSSCAVPVCLTDVLATCADVAGVAIEEDTGEDSFSLLPYLEGRDPSMPRAPVVHHSSNGTFALRDGDWKLILGSGSGGRGEPRSKPFSEPYQLYHMKSDPSEQTDLAGEHPEIVAALTAKLEKIRSSGRSRAVSWGLSAGASSRGADEVKEAAVEVIGELKQ